MSTSRDLAGLIKGLQLIVDAQLKLQKETLNHICRTSSVFPLIQDCLKDGLKPPKPDNINTVANNIVDGVERVNVVVEGLKAYTEISLGNVQKKPETLLIHRLVQRPQIAATETSKIGDLKEEYQIKLSESDKQLLKRLDMEHKAKLVKQADREKEHSVERTDTKTVGETINEAKVAAIPNPKAKLKLSDNAKQRKVPSSRVGRMMSFGSLAAGLGVGTAAEFFKTTFGFGEVTSDGQNLFMNKGNMERIVDTLCKVRGAALKLGQILSIQDESMVNPELAKALERVRKSADFMPDWQVDQVMITELGQNWADNFTKFEKRPFAAASIGQVHYAKLKDGRDVAIKIQYPGVAKGIESDIDNLGGIMKMWNIFPKGMFLDNLMAVAKRELAWEVDYLREAECTKKFQTLLAGYEGFYVPYVVDDVSTKQIFTTELLDGIPVDQCFDMDYEHKQFIGDRVMELCLMEILRFRYMQTDPNWANFLYNPTKKQLMLLDFGASREYSKEFMDKYVQVLKGACDGNRDAVLTLSREMGFLTGYESKIMQDAHVDSVMILGEIFRVDGKYDFAHQDMTNRIQDLAQTMLTHRLCPPPEEVYSLHRKLSGVFLLLFKLKVQIDCKSKFLTLYDEYMKLNPN